MYQYPNCWWWEKNSSNGMRWVPALSFHCHRQSHTYLFYHLQTDSSTVTPVTLRVDPLGYFLYWTDQNEVWIILILVMGQLLRCWHHTWDNLPERATWFNLLNESLFSFLFYCRKHKCWICAQYETLEQDTSPKSPKIQRCVIRFQWVPQAIQLRTKL